MKYEHDTDNQYDLTDMIVKPLYFGMVFNVIIPAALLFVCHYVNNNYFPENHIPDLSNALFYVFCALALVQAGLALWWRNRLLDKPMVHRQESFEHDVGSALFVRLRPVFLLVAAISLWGYLYFILAGRFEETVALVVFSFVVFQVVRPRLGSVKKLIAYQQKLVNEGRFASGTFADIRKEVQGE
jgi:small-conductance mechanosensitive channel